MFNNNQFSDDLPETLELTDTDKLVDESLFDNDDTPDTSIDSMFRYEFNPAIQERPIDAETVFSVVMLVTVFIGIFSACL